MGKKVVLAGGSGFLGQHLADFLINNGYEVVILSRKAATTQGAIKFVQWDAKHLGTWAEEIDGCYAVVNFTGKSVNCIYTKSNREEIISSRVNSVRVLREAIDKCVNPPQAFVQAGSLAIYGNTRDLCNEHAVHGEGFSADVCEQWESEFFRESSPNTRQVVLRIGFVLGEDGGALGSLKNLVKYNLGGTVGSGKQYISWIHVNDLNGMLLKAIEDENTSGIYNATSPTPVTNKTFMKALRTVMGKGWAPPAPTPFVWLGAYLFMRTDPSLGLTSQRAVPQHFMDQGFEFQYTDLNRTLQDLV
jgi:uncharacterized protein